MIELSVVRDLVAIASFVVALTYYVINIRHQRETRQAQTFLQVFNNFTSKEFREANGVIDEFKIYILYSNNLTATKLEPFKFVLRNTKLFQ